MSRSSAARVLAALALASMAWPAVAARQWDDQALMPAQTLFGWTRPAPAAPGPSGKLVELAQKERDAIVPPVKRQQPQMPSAREPAGEPQPPPAQAPAPAEVNPPAEAAAEKPRAPAGEAAHPSPPVETTARWTDLGSIFSPVTDWLAKANREYQGTIVKELSKPSPQEMEAQAKQQEEEKAAQAEAARKAEAAVKQAAAEEAARKKAEADAAARKSAEAAAKDAEARKQAEAKKQAEATREAEAKKQGEASKEAETRKQAEAVKAAEAAKQAEHKKAAEAEAEARRQSDAAKLAEEKRHEQAKQEEQRRMQLKQEQERKEKADAERKAREAKLAEERKTKEDARVREAAERAQKAAATKQESVAAATVPDSSQRHRRWTVTIIPEPIERPSAEPIEGRELSLPRVREANAVMLGSRQLSGRMSLGGGSLKGPTVKRWVWRAGTCRFAGRKVSKNIRYTVAQGDSLWRISEKYYDRGGKYPRIYNANRDRIDDPDLIYPCQRFRVPRR